MTCEHISLPDGGSAINVKAIATFLRSGRYRVGTEALLQEDVERRLHAGSVPYKREYVLAPGERLDFLVADTIAVELKIRAPRKSIYRQLERYARHEAITGVVLVTASAIGMPPTLAGKPVYVVQLGLSAL